MIEYKAGMLAKSKAGHDKEKITAVEDAYVYLADGFLRKLANPKKKKKKHIQLIGCQFELSDCDDVKIKYILKQYQKEVEKKDV